MSLLDFLFNFSTDQVLTATANSTNTYDAGVARKLFSGWQKKLGLVLNITAVSGTSPTLRARLVGADDAALTSNVIDIADSGTFTPVANTQKEIVIGPQASAKRHYGIIYTVGGTSPSITLDTEISPDKQENLNP